MHLVKHPYLSKQQRMRHQITRFPPLLTIKIRIIIKEINLPNVVLISMDSFYKIPTPQEALEVKNSNYNFDVPGEEVHLDWPLLS